MRKFIDYFAEPVAWLLFLAVGLCLIAGTGQWPVFCSWIRQGIFILAVLIGSWLPALTRTINNVCRTATIALRRF